MIKTTSQWPIKVIAIANANQPAANQPLAIAADRTIIIAAIFANSAKTCLPNARFPEIAETWDSRAISAYVQLPIITAIPPANADADACRPAINNAAAAAANAINTWRQTTF